MIDVDAEKEAFLAHYGVKGMRWGKRKLYSPDGSRELSGKEARAVRKEARTQRSVDRGRALRDRQGGDSAARLKSGRNVALGVIAAVGTKVALNRLPMNPVVRNGLITTANLVSIGISVNEIKKMNDLNRAAYADLPDE